eukprot:6288286-Prymnesium_polylepis.2
MVGLRQSHQSMTTMTFLRRRAADEAHLTSEWLRLSSAVLESGTVFGAPSQPLSYTEKSLAG